MKCKHCFNFFIIENENIDGICFKDIPIVEVKNKNSECFNKEEGSDVFIKN